jgi:hypothetical protein
MKDVVHQLTDQLTEERANSKTLRANFDTLEDKFDNLATQFTELKEQTLVCAPTAIPPVDPSSEFKDLLTNHMQQLTAALVTHVSTNASVQSHETPKRRHDPSLSDQAHAASTKIRRLNNAAELTSIATCQHAISHPSPFRDTEPNNAIPPPPSTQRVHARVQQLNTNPEEFEPVSEDFITTAAQMAGVSYDKQAPAANTFNLLSPTQTPALATQAGDQATLVVAAKDPSVFQGEIFSPVSPSFRSLASPVSLHTRSHPHALDPQSSRKDARAGTI